MFTMSCKLLSCNIPVDVRLYRTTAFTFMMAMKALVMTTSTRTSTRISTSAMMVDQPVSHSAHSVVELLTV